MHQREFPFQQEAELRQKEFTFLSSIDQVASGHKISPHIITDIDELTLKNPRFNSSFHEYLDPHISIEQRFEIAAQNAGLTTEEKMILDEFLAPLKAHDYQTYAHSLRVALLCQKIARYCHQEEKELFLAGALHDIGKAEISQELLLKTSNWTSEDFEIMSRHVLHGFYAIKKKAQSLTSENIRDTLLFIADTVKWHHRFQLHSYPEHLPPDNMGTDDDLNEKERHCAKLLALADSFDASHRINRRRDFNEHSWSGIGEQIKKNMISSNANNASLIKALYQAGIFTTHLHGVPHQETVDLDNNDDLYLLSFLSQDLTQREPSNTARQIQLACGLEALPDKAGCTTRNSNSSRHLRLPYFIAAGINIGEAFEKMSRYLVENKKANGIYSFAKEAQLGAKRNIRGGRINQGIIELLPPIVAAQYLTDPNFTCHKDKILESATHLLSETRRDDVDELLKLKKIAYNFSHIEREIPEHGNAESVADYYKSELEKNSHRETSKAHNGEFLSNFRTISLVYDTLQNCQYPHFENKLEEAYTRAQAFHHKEVSPGFIADCIAVGTYLYLSQNPASRLIG